MCVNKEISIRPLRTGDGSFLCSIFRDNREYYEIFHDPADTVSQWENRVLHFLRQNEVVHYIVEASGVPVGWLSYADTQTGERELCILVIHRERLSCGYGSAALSWLIGISREVGIKSLLLNVSQTNERAIRFYRKFGFEICGEETVPECNDRVNVKQYRMGRSLTDI